MDEINSREIENNRGQAIINSLHRYNTFKNSLNACLPASGSDNRGLTPVFQIISLQRSDHARAIALMDQHALGLRAGDVLHVAIAQNREMECLNTLDHHLLDAARKFKIKAVNPIE